MKPHGTKEEYEGNNLGDDEHIVIRLRVGRAAWQHRHGQGRVDQIFQVVQPAVQQPSYEQKYEYPGAHKCSLPQYLSTCCNSLGHA